MSAVVHRVALSDEETSALLAAFGRVNVRRYPCGCFTYDDVDDRLRRKAHRVCEGHTR